jgi:hypothetical protein
MRKTIVTAAGPNMAPVLTAISLPMFASFAKRHGYKMQAMLLYGLMLMFSYVVLYMAREKSWWR